jgi:hypothetical protein
MSWLLMALLGVAVICWGLHSKLSLYQSAAARHGVPVAKILSQKERAVANAPMERLTACGFVSTFAHEAGSGGGSGILLPAQSSSISCPASETLVGDAARKLLPFRSIQSGSRAPPITIE